MSRRSAFFAIVVSAVAVGSAPVRAQMDAGRSSVTIATASPGGNYFLAGNAICRALQRQGHYLDTGDVTLINCATMSTAGSIQNVDLLRNRIVDTALVQSDWHYHAYSGTDRFAGRKVDNLRSLVSLNEEAFQLVAGRGTNIQSWSDMKAKKVNIGPSESTINTMFQELFKVHGVDEKWLAQALRLSPTQHVQEMCEGNIEALGQTSGVPNGAIQDAIGRCGATLVSLETPEIRKMVDDLSYYTPVSIPKGTYNGQVSDVATFGVVSTLVATSEMPESIAYSIVRAIFEGLDAMQASVPVLSKLTPEGMIADGLTAPLHPGAARYFRERGLIRQGRPTAAATSAAVVAAQSAPSPQVPAQTQPSVRAQATATGLAKSESGSAVKAVNSQKRNANRVSR